MNDEIRVTEPADGVGMVTIDAPPRNILDSESWVAVERALGELRERGSRVVVLSSAVDGYFMAHGSLTRILDVFSGGDGGDVGAQRRVMRELDTGPMVSIAAVDGQAWGGGAELCWSCDLRVAGTTASFAQPEIHLGLTPGWGGASKVAHLVGEAAALRLVLDGRPVTGEEAGALGLAHRVVRSGAAERTALEWAEWLAARPPWALAANKALVKGGRTLDLRDALRRELEAFAECASRPEALALVRAAQERYDDGGDSYEAFDLPRRRSW